MSECEEKEYLWHHFVFNAEQRLKAFNFFVVFSVFADGGVFAAVEKELPGAVFSLIGGFIVALSLVFWVIDIRSQGLLKLAVPGLKEYESKFPEHSRLFDIDARRNYQFIRYTNAFRVLFALQLLFGFGVISYGLCLWL